jgi:hypothetical protein
MYSFDSQNSIGQQAERELDAYFRKFYEIQYATMTEQRRGIDRHFHCRTFGHWWSVEYKSDWTAARTSNAFIETVSVDTSSAPGWIRKSESQVLVYFVPPLHRAFVYFIPQMKLLLMNWSDRYETRTIPNKGRNGDTYNTIGLLVPLASLARLCYREIKIPPLQDAA